MTTELKFYDLKAKKSFTTTKYKEIGRASCRERV